MDDTLYLRGYITIYRIINLFIFGPYSLYSGFIYNDVILSMIGILIIIVDFLLLWHKTRGEQTLQPFRFLGILAGIYWIYAYYLYNDGILLTMGFLHVFMDGLLLMG